MFQMGWNHQLVDFGVWRAHLNPSQQFLPSAVSKPKFAQHPSTPILLRLFAYGANNQTS